MHQHSPRVRGALVALAVGLALVGCGHEPGQPPVGTATGQAADLDDVVSVSATAFPLLQACPCDLVVTLTPDDQLVLTREYAPDLDPVACADRDTSQRSGKAPEGTFERVATLVRSEPYASLDDTLYPSADIMDGSFDYVTVQTVDQTQTKGGHMVGTYGPQAFVDVFSLVWDSAVDAGLLGS